MISQTDPCLALQGAMVAALRADAALQALSTNGVRIVDRVDTETFPYIRVGEDRVDVYDTTCGSSAVIWSTVRVYSRAPGKPEAKRIAARLRFLLTKQGGFLVDGWRVTLGHCEGYSFEDHDDGLTTQAIVDFKYRIDPVAS